MRELIFIASLLMLTSCYTKNQAVRKFCVPLVKDTIITIHDTVQLQSSQVDTVFVQQHSDTVVVENDSVRVEYIRFRDTIYLRGTAKPRTVYITKKVPVRLTQPCPPAKEPPWWHTYIIGLFLFLALWFAVSIALLSVTRR